MECNECKYILNDGTCGAFECNGLECPELPCEINPKDCIRSVRDEKVRILNSMLDSGFLLGGYTFDEYIDMFTLEEWKQAEKKFLNKLKELEEIYKNVPGGYKGVYYRHNGDSQFHF